MNAINKCATLSEKECKQQEQTQEIDDFWEKRAKKAAVEVYRKTHPKIEDR